LSARRADGEQGPAVRRAAGAAAGNGGSAAKTGSADDPRGEMRVLSESLRRHLEGERRRGRTQIRLKGEVPGPPAPAGAVSSGGEPAPAAESAPPPTAKPRKTEKPQSPGEPGKPGESRPAGTASASPAASRKQGKLSRVEIEPEPADYAARMKTMTMLAEEASECVKCGLCKTRKNVVFARGRARNRVMFIGEAPGADEDAQGLPFVGRAGKLLDQIIDAIGFDREEIYVANILKCRPPQNRDPRPEEIAACTPYLEEQIRLVQPKVICALGKFAAQFLTGKPKATMGQLRGRIHYYRETIMVLPTYHPAALLRNPQWKRIVWEDVQLLRKEYLR
jgi:uracil-DNA glycosylase family 4